MPTETDAPRLPQLAVLTAVAAAVLLTGCTAGRGPRKPAETLPTGKPTTTISGAPGVPCSGTSLAVALRQGSGAAGHFYVPVVFTNNSPTPCTITGYPTIGYLSSADGYLVGDVADQTGGPARTVRLGAAGGTASALVDEVDVDVYPTATCQPTAVAGLRVTPPGTGSATFLSQPNARACTKQMAGQPQLRVRPVVPGTSGA